jgi:prolyl oligopeptidase
MWRRVRYSVIVMLLGLTQIDAVFAGDVVYPETKREMVTDTHYGTVVSDPYRWLEFSKSPEVVEWLKQQNEVTDTYLDETPQWRQIAERITALTKNKSKEYASFRYVGRHSFVLYKSSSVSNLGFSRFGGRQRSHA